MLMCNALAVVGSGVLERVEVSRNPKRGDCTMPQEDGDRHAHCCLHHACVARWMAVAVLDAHVQPVQFVHRQLRHAHRQHQRRTEGVRPWFVSENAKKVAS